MAGPTEGRHSDAQSDGGTGKSGSSTFANSFTGSIQS